MVALVFLGRCVWLVLNYDLLRQSALHGVEILRDNPRSTSDVEAKVPGQMREELGMMQECLKQGTELIQKVQSSWCVVYRAHLHWRAACILQAGNRMSSSIFCQIWVNRGSRSDMPAPPEPLTLGQKMRGLWWDLCCAIWQRLPWVEILTISMYIQVIWRMLQFNFFALKWVLLGVLVAGAFCGVLVGGIFFMAHGIGAIFGLAVAVQVNMLILAISVFICLE